MRRELKKKFLPENYRQDSFLKFHNFKQKDLSVEEYTTEFDKLQMLCDIVESEEQTIARYLGGLHLEIGNIVQLQPYWSYNDVEKLALKVERHIKERRGSTPRFRVKEFNTNRASTSNTKLGPAPKVDTPVKTTHNQEVLASSSRPKQGRCFKCQGYGHHAVECRNRKIVSLVKQDGEDVDEDTNLNFDEAPRFDEEITYGDKGESLVIRRSLNVAYVEEDNWLRNDIFHTRCTSHGKVCNVIIDGGSCEKVIVAIMVEKLNLKTVDHPRPYRLSWLRKGNEVKVNQRCLVQFSIGKFYKDEVWGDVVPMDACHLLLGRPWQYDRKVLHDGFKNIYSFEKDGVKIVLSPMKKEGTLKPKKEEGNNLLTKYDFLVDFEETQEAYALVVLQDNEDNGEIPLELQPLLHEFRDVIPKEIPCGLPPLRDIQHCIDFVLGAAIPNKAAYRMNPKEFEELQRQVDELLSKGLIRESMSPCVVPALLVPKQKEKAWHMCTDSCAVNKITIKYQFPMPRLNDLLDQLHGATIFSKIDLRIGYHQTRMRLRDEWKTAFKTRDSLYEWMVMPFGLSNAPSTFMRLMNHAFKSFIGRFVVVYFDDILIFSKDPDTHMEHLCQVFNVLKEQKLYANLKKCEFLTNKLVFLGYVISGEGIMVDPTKVEGITSWPILSLIQEVRSFHGFASFYRRFIRGFNTVMAPIIECLKGGTFHWSHEAQKSLELIKRKMTEAPILVLLDFNKVFEVDCDASNVGIGAVLSQEGKPIVFFSKKLANSRARYSTYDNEFYAIIRALDHWRHYLLSKEFILYSNHEALKFINGQHKLNQRHARWVEFLQAYTFHIKHKSGKHNQVADALSRRHSCLNIMQMKVRGFEKLHEQVRERIIKKNEKYQRQANKHRKPATFKEGDLVWVHLHKERFPRGKNGKLKPQADGPFKVLQRVGDNAYKIELSGGYGVSSAFNVVDLSPYHG
nr:uncharacterized protein LOC114827423 [Malus domestica]